MPDTTNTEVKGLPPVFEESSQYQHWRFSPEALWDIRNKSTDAAVNRVKKNIQEDLMVSNSQEEEKERKNKIEYLSRKEELDLCRYYEYQLYLMCQHCKFSKMVMGTAIMYLKRFYLYNSAMDYHPRNIVLTCLFLATKSESERISIDELQTRLGLKDEQVKPILDLEYTVSQGLKFQYYIHHPYRPAYGFFLDMQTGPVDVKLLKESYKSVTENIIKDMLMTDLPLIYQPPQLALAAFMIAGESNGFASQVEKYIAFRFGVGGTEKKDAEALFSILQDIIKMYKNDKPPQSREQVDKAKKVAAEIDLKLKECQNPALIPNTAIYKKRLAERQEESSRHHKIAKMDMDLTTSEESSSTSSPASTIAI